MAARKWGWVAMLLCMAGAQAADRWVAGPGGSPMALPDAVAKAADGDTIELLAGDYPGGLVIENKRLTLRGMLKAGPHNAPGAVTGAVFCIKGAMRFKEGAQPQMHNPRPKRASIRKRKPDIPRKSVQ